MKTKRDGQAFQISRRDMFARGILAAAGLAAGVSAQPAFGLPYTTTDASGRSVSGNANAIDTLNFLLNLQYLQTEFYHRATAGLANVASSDVDGVGRMGEVVGGHLVAFSSPAIREYATEIAADELGHLRTLRDLIPARKRACRPAINLEGSFNKAAGQAGVTALGESFNAFASDETFLLAAYFFENLIIATYRGVLPSLSNFDHVKAISGIMTIQAQQTAVVRATLHSLALETPELFEAVDLFTTLLNDLGGSAIHQPIRDEKGRANLMSTDRTGDAFAHSINEVLSVVYLGASPTPLSFFPNGLNGKIS